jgi:selenophosphate synthase
MIILNDVGLELSWKNNMIFGFGLMGHLLEVCEGSNVSALIIQSACFQEIHDYIDKNASLEVHKETGIVTVINLTLKMKATYLVIHKLVDY